MSKPSERAIEVLNLQNEFEFKGKTYIAIKTPTILEDEEACMNLCAFFKYCAKGQKPDGIPFCHEKIRADGLNVCFIEKGNRFRPKIGQEYWIASTDGRAQNFTWSDDWMDKKHLETFNTFPTREAAQKVCDKIAELLKAEAQKWKSK